MKNYYVYILSNKKNGTLYIGVTNSLKRRIYEHKVGYRGGFTKKYGLKKLVWFQIFNDINKAIESEKRMKKWKCEYKINVIKQMNPEWEDLCYKIFFVD
jgi:putative endonuclease